MSLDNIIARFLGNKATAEELKQLNQWKDEAQQNVDALEDMSKIWESSSDLKDYKTFDTQRAFMKVSSKIVDEELKSDIAPKKSKSIIRTLLPLAASLLLICAAVFMVRNYVSSDKSPSEYTSTTELMAVTLTDDSNITLDKSSTVRLISDFKDERVVEASGRVHFDVASDKEKPFKVKTAHGTVRVLGTNFTVNTKDNRTEVYLYEGSVQYDDGHELIELSPSEAIISDAKGTTKIRFDVNNMESWRLNKLVFNDVNIEDVFSSLETHFEISVDQSSKLIDANCKLNSSFNRLDLKNIMEELKVIFDLKYTIEGKTVVIHKLSC